MLPLMRDEIQQAIAQSVALRSESCLLSVLEPPHIIKAARATKSPLSRLRVAGVAVVVSAAERGRLWVVSSTLVDLGQQELIKVVECGSKVAALEVTVREPPRARSPVLQPVGLAPSRSKGVVLIALLPFESQQRERADVVAVPKVRLEVEEHCCRCRRRAFLRSSLRSGAANSTGDVAGARSCSLGYEHLRTRVSRWGSVAFRNDARTMEPKSGKLHKVPRADHVAWSCRERPACTHRMGVLRCSSAMASSVQSGLRNGCTSTAARSSTSPWRPSSLCSRSRALARPPSRARRP
ncbi:hypothetical protein PybrP1_000932 [[Pythium] brassicae (nom. inval.)]|nr:hypothetical protein PybrP1_000932 [[Pythium] brassicae (nom. inval.)]